MSNQWKDGKPLGHKCDEKIPESLPVVYTAFYLWYGNPEVDGNWIHWNHCILPHWDPTVDAKYKKFNWTPPDMHHSPYRPSKGLYSSSDVRTLRTQFAEMKLAGIDVAVTSWWGRRDWHGHRDHGGSGANTDAIMQRVLDAANQSGVKVAIHLEPYGGRDHDSVKDDIEYIHKEYGNHPALYKRRRKDITNQDIWNPQWTGEALPVIFLYDVSRQHINAAEQSKWRDMISSLRGSQFDAYLVGLYIGTRGRTQQDERFLEDVGFDAGYSYFASVGFTPATDYGNFNWDRINENMLEHSQMDFIPSFGPGYNDTMLRPWNGANTQDRGNAVERYGKLFHHAKYMPHGLMITSFNEWGEGTQIEPAMPYTSQSGLEYMDYRRHFPDEIGDCDDCYLRMTKREGDLYKSRFCEGVDSITHVEL
jgi:glycoprotein endo-alpha-1,2-mannosidase